MVSSLGRCLSVSQGQHSSQPAQRTRHIAAGRCASELRATASDIGGWVGGLLGLLLLSLLAFILARSLAYLSARSIEESLRQPASQCQRRPEECVRGPCGSAQARLGSAQIPQEDNLVFCREALGAQGEDHKHGVHCRLIHLSTSG